MSTNIEEVLSNDERSFLYKVIENACFMNKEFLEHNGDLFNNVFEPNIQSRILTHIMNIQFLNTDFMKNCPFSLKIETKGSMKMWKLAKDGLILTFKQLKNKNDIVRLRSKYMKQYSKGNEVLDGQQCFFEKEFTNNSLYGIIVFSEMDINTQKPKFANILFPNEKMKAVYADIDLLPKLRVIKSWEDIKDEKTDIITVESLKKDFKNGVKIKNE